MDERWRRPVRIEAIEPAPEVVLIGDRLVQEEEVILSDPQDFERLRLGYVCPQCFEPFEYAYPESCNVCSYPVRARAHDFLESHFKGETWIGPTESYDDEVAGINERAQKKKEDKARELGIVLPRPQGSILVPNGLN